MDERYAWGIFFSWNICRAEWLKLTWKEGNPKKMQIGLWIHPPPWPPPLSPKGWQSLLVRPGCCHTSGFLWNGFIRLTLHHNLHLKWTPNPPKDRGRRRLSGIFFNALVSAQVVTICCWYLSAQDINQTSHPLKSLKSNESWSLDYRLKVNISTTRWSWRVYSDITQLSSVSSIQPKNL